MKVAHFATFAPYQCGQYATVKDLILAERQVGIDAQFIDVKDTNKIKTDGVLSTVTLDWAFNSDILVRHTEIPVVMLKSGIPIFLALHGRPESSFRMEQEGKNILSAVMAKTFDNKYRGLITFWQEHISFWKYIALNKTVFYVSPPVDLYTYTMMGDMHKFSVSGSPNLLICDIWRDDTTPFNLLYAAMIFKEKYAPNAKLHIYGAPKDKYMLFLNPLKKCGLLGETFSIVTHLDKIYRSADILLTCNNIATRVVRESLASGLPIVAPYDCKYTEFVSNVYDPEAFAKQINYCWLELQEKGKEIVGKECRKIAEKEFNFEKTGTIIKKIFEGVLSYETCTCI